MPRTSGLGIAARLSIAFGAVTLLAVVANQIAEHGSALVRRMAATQLVPATLDDRTAEALPAALDQFQRAVLARIDSQAAPRVAAQDEAVAALDAARAGYFDALRPTMHDAALSGMEAQVAAHADLGAQLVRSADARRRPL